MPSLDLPNLQLDIESSPQGAGHARIDCAERHSHPQTKGEPDGVHPGRHIVVQNSIDHQQLFIEPDSTSASALFLPIHLRFIVFIKWVAPDNIISGPSVPFLPPTPNNGAVCPAPSVVFFSAEHHYVKQFHSLHRVMTVNQPSPFRNRKCLMENEICSILGCKNAPKNLCVKAK
jgi:hypothetical protein